MILLDAPALGQDRERDKRPAALGVVNDAGHAVSVGGQLVAIRASENVLAPSPASAASNPAGSSTVTRRVHVRLISGYSSSVTSAGLPVWIMSPVRVIYNVVVMLSHPFPRVCRASVVLIVSRPYGAVKTFSPSPR